MVAGRGGGCCGTVVVVIIMEVVGYPLGGHCQVADGLCGGG